MKEKPITKIFVEPIKVKNPSLSPFENKFPKTAACPLPSPGRNPHNGEAITDDKTGFIIFLPGEEIFCSGICVLFFILKIKSELPNNPVNIGSRGSFNSKFKAHKPNSPEIKKTNNAANFLFSVKIKIENVINKIQNILDTIKS